MSDNQDLQNNGITVLNEQSSNLTVFNENNFSVKKLNPAQSYMISLGSENSRTTVKSQLGRIAGLLGFQDFNQIPWEAFERQHVLTILQLLKNEGKAPATIKGHLSVIKSVSREAWSQRLMDTDTYTHIMNVKAPRGDRIPKGRALSVSEVQKLLSTCIEDRSNRGVRDTAIVAVLVGCGLRRAELVSLQYGNIILRDRAIKLVGKGNKERMAYVPDFTWAHLEDWIQNVRGDGHGPLFTRIRAGDDVTENGLSLSGLSRILEYRRIESVWIEPFSPHDLRRTFASQLLEQDTDLNTVKDLMGHSSITTTQKYDHRDKKRLEKAGRNLKY